MLSKLLSNLNKFSAKFLTIFVTNENKSNKINSYLTIIDLVKRLDKMKTAVIEVPYKAIMEDEEDEGRQEEKKDDDEGIRMDEDEGRYEIFESCEEDDLFDPISILLGYFLTVSPKIREKGSKIQIFNPGKDKSLIQEPETTTPSQNLLLPTSESTLNILDYFRFFQRLISSDLKTWNKFYWGFMSPEEISLYCDLEDAEGYKNSKYNLEGPKPDEIIESKSKIKDSYFEFKQDMKKYDNFLTKNSELDFNQIMKKKVFKVISYLQLPIKDEINASEYNNSKPSVYNKKMNDNIKNYGSQIFV